MTGTTLCKDYGSNNAPCFSDVDAELPIHTAAPRIYSALSRDCKRVPPATYDLLHALVTRLEAGQLCGCVRVDYGAQPELAKLVPAPDPQVPFSRCRYGVAPATCDAGDLR